MAEWNFALPENEEIFKSMSDILYTYLYSISKHNPKKRRDGTFIEDYNYIYIDKGSNGQKGYSHKETYEKLGLSKTTYYRKFKKLEELNLIRRTVYHGRKIIQIPFIDSNKVLNV